MLKWTRFNPKFALIIGIIENIGLFFIMLGHATTENMIFFVITNLIIKGIPYYTLRNTILYKKDILAFFALFGIYLLWTQLNKWIYGSQIEIGTIENVVQSLIHNKNDTPGLYFFHWLKNRLNI